ncbi:MAG: DUF4446 family protein [Lachnospiraceae bacterium]|nr:DUF4446 family protein [Lachnospiraceae bacterium]
MNIFEKAGIDIGIVVLLLIVLVVILTAMVCVMSFQLDRVKKKYRIFMKGKDAQSLEKVFANKFREIEKITAINEHYQFDIDMLKKESMKTLKKYGIVKYDAFDDVGGKLSFALAMLDRNNTGFVLDAIHSRDNCFVYMKEIVKGESYVMLSKEEIKALKLAVNFIDTDEFE